MPGHSAHAQRPDRPLSVSTNDLRRGMTLDLDGQLYQVVEFQHVKPGKGGAFVRTKLRNVKTGGVVDRTFNAGVAVGLAIVDRREMQYLYRDGDALVFMDSESYEQHNVPVAAVGEAANYLTEGASAILAMHGGNPIGVELPTSVTLRVSDTEPGMRGDRVSGAMKPATLETGLIVQVPLFVEPGELVKVDTRTGEYLTRAK